MTSRCLPCYSSYPPPPPPQVLSRGKVVAFGSQKFISSGDNKQTLRFKVTVAMVPSVRLLVYYILFGGGANELVADAVWLDVRDKCVNGLQVHTYTHTQTYPYKHTHTHILMLCVCASDRCVVSGSSLQTKGKPPSGHPDQSGRAGRLVGC